MCYRDSFGFCPTTNFSSAISSVLMDAKDPKAEIPSESTGISSLSQSQHEFSVSFMLIRNGAYMTLASKWLSESRVIRERFAWDSGYPTHSMAVGMT